eukprot:547873_1
MTYASFFCNVFTVFIMHLESIIRTIQKHIWNVCAIIFIIITQSYSFQNNLDIQSNEMYYCCQIKRSQNEFCFGDHIIWFNTNSSKQHSLTLTNIRVSKQSISFKDSNPLSRKHTKKIKKCWLYESHTDKNPTEIPINVALQRIDLLRDIPHFFPAKYNQNIADLLQSYEWIQETAKLAALSLYAYYHNMKEGDHFYNGIIQKIVQFEATMSVDLTASAQIINVGELFAYRWMSYDMKSIVIVFRGTDLVCDENWSIDFQTKAMDINLTEYDIDINSGKVYSGIYRIVHENMDKFQNLLNDMNIGIDNTVYLTGHSLGSGFAQMMLLHMYSNIKLFKDMRNEFEIKNTEIKVTTFGGPATMDVELTKQLQLIVGNKIFLVKKLEDPVSFTGDTAYNFLSQVLQGKRNTKRVSVSTSVQFLKVKMRTGKYNRELGLQGLEDVRNIYTHLGQQVVVQWSATDIILSAVSKDIRVVQHGEYLNANVFYLSRYGNQGWFVDAVANDTHFHPKTTIIESEMESDTELIELQQIAPVKSIQLLKSVGQPERIQPQKISAPMKTIPKMQRQVVEIKPQYVAPLLPIETPMHMMTDVDNESSANRRCQLSFLVILFIAGLINMFVVVLRNA